MTGLPRRPYVPEPPPMDGLQEVRREASRRRRVRTVRVTAGGAATAAAAAALVVALTGATGGADTLQPLPPAVGHDQSTAPAPSTVGGHIRQPAGSVATPRTPGAGTSSTGSTSHGGAAGSGEQAPPAAPAAPSGAGPRSQPSQSGDIRLRVYRTHGTMSGTQVCSGDFSSNQTSLGNGLGWCRAVSAVKVPGGVRLRLTACRDDTSGGTLSYSSRREVDFVVRQNGKSIWDWGQDHPDSPGAHTRRAAADDCWNWELVWPDVRQSGRSAGHGHFTFVATTTADELSGYPPATVRFRY